MGNPAVDRNKREMVIKALHKLQEGQPLARARLFDGYEEFKDVQQKVLKALIATGAIKRIETPNPSIVFFTAKNTEMLRSILRSESEVTRLIWPNLAPPLELPPAPEVEEPPEQENVPPSPYDNPPPPSRAGTVDAEMKATTKEILEKQVLILDKVVDPIGENILWVRDRVIELKAEMEEMKETLGQILGILRKLE